MSYHVVDKHIKGAERMVDKAHAAGGLAPVDLEKFWRDNAESLAREWDADCPQMPLALGMNGEVFLAELGVEPDWYKYHHDAEWSLPYRIAYNDKAEEVVGRRFQSETLPDPERAWPPIKKLYDIFEARNVWHNESYWLQQSAATPEELSALLDRVEERLENLRSFLLPENWQQEKKRLLDLGCKAPLYRRQRGPVTFAMSIHGVENLIFLCYDNPELAERFSDLICRTILARARILDEEAGFTPETAPHGWGWYDDNCCMLNAEMYELFGYPILKKVFERYSPAANDRRYQHSDSPMGHLLPLLGKLNMTGVNLGPTLSVTEIREHMPNAVIYGQLAPYTLSRNEEVNIVAETLRDMELARDKKGIAFTTAGSVNNGSRLSGLRLIMATIQEYKWGL